MEYHEVFVENIPVHDTYAIVVFGGGVSKYMIGALTGTSLLTRQNTPTYEKPKLIDQYTKSMIPF